jgi:Gametolysin peptidase M11
MVNETAVIPDISKPVFGDARRRRDRRLALSGTIQVVVVRITCGLKQVTNSLATIKSDVFSDAVCLKSQLEACSNQKLRVEPGPFDGAIDLSISACNSESETRNSATSALTSMLGRHPEQIPNTYFMYCIPPNLNQAWSGIAYAYIGGTISVYNNLWCGYVSGQMHEIGHNFNLGHAGEDGDVYGDRTGIMGYSYREDDQYMCYNGPNMYQLGWLTNAQVFTSKPSGTYTLVGHTNYMGGLQIIRIRGTPSGSDTYIWFNHAAGIHSNTKEGWNQVIVTTRPAGTGYGLSSTQAKLSASASYTASSGYYSVQVLSISNGQAVVSFGGSNLPLSPTPAPVPNWWDPAPTATPAPVPNWWDPAPIATFAPVPNWWDPVPTSPPAPVTPPAPITNWWDPVPTSPPAPVTNWWDPVPTSPPAPVTNWWDPVPTSPPAPVTNWWDPAPVTNWWTPTPAPVQSISTAAPVRPPTPAPVPVRPPTPAPVRSCTTYTVSNCPSNRCQRKNQRCIARN